MKRASRLIPQTTKYTRMMPSEGDDVRERIQIRAEQRFSPGAARPVAVKDVAAERDKQKNERNPEEPVTSFSDIVQTQEDGYGSASGIAEREHIRHGIGPEHGKAFPL